MDQDEEGKKKNISSVSLFEVVKMSTPEWPVVTIGCVGSLIMGAAMPVFAIIFGDIVGVSWQVN